MKMVGRLVTRGSGDDGEGTVDLILGAGFKQGTLKPNTIYEIMDIDGELIIYEEGASSRCRHMWMKDANRILEEDFPYAIMTTEEIAKHMEKNHK